MKSRHQDLNQICEQFGVFILYAFGSQAKKIRNLVKGRQNIPLLSSSDVDIGVTVISGGKFSVTEKVNLALALEDLFACKRVDWYPYQRQIHFWQLRSSGANGSLLIMSMRLMNMNST